MAFSSLVGVSTDILHILGSLLNVFYIYLLVCSPELMVMWSSEDNMAENGSLHSVGPRDQSQIIRFDSEVLYLLSHLADFVFLNTVSATIVTGIQSIFHCLSLVYKKACK